RHAVLPEESSQDFDALVKAYLIRLAAAGTYGSCLVEKMAAAQWCMRRLWDVERNLFVEAAQKHTGVGRAPSDHRRLLYSARPALRLRDPTSPDLPARLRNLQLTRKTHIPNEPKPAVQ